MGSSSEKSARFQAVKNALELELVLGLFHGEGLGVGRMWRQVGSSGRKSCGPHHSPHPVTFRHYCAVGWVAHHVSIAF